MTIPWKEGLHLRTATQVVRHARSFHSTIVLRVNERMTDARSMLGALLLCATLGSVMVLEVSGEDEDAALATLTSLFEPKDADFPHGPV